MKIIPLQETIYYNSPYFSSLIFTFKLKYFMKEITFSSWTMLLIILSINRYYYPRWCMTLSLVCLRSPPVSVQRCDKTTST